MRKKVEYLINVDLHGVKAGMKILLEVDEQGTLLDRNWRRRLKDSKIDGCMTKVEQPKSKSSDQKDK